MKPAVTEFLLGFCGDLRLSAAGFFSATLSVILLLFAAKDSDFLLVVLLKEILILLLNYGFIRFSNKSMFDVCRDSNQELI